MKKTGESNGNNFYEVTLIYIIITQKSKFYLKYNLKSSNIEFMIVPDLKIETLE